jgi:hypothetical protein
LRWRTVHGRRTGTRTHWAAAQRRTGADRFFGAQRPRGAARTHRRSEHGGEKTWTATVSEGPDPPIGLEPRASRNGRRTATETAFPLRSSVQKRQVWGTSNAAIRVPSHCSTPSSRRFKPVFASRPARPREWLRNGKARIGTAPVPLISRASQLIETACRHAREARRHQESRRPILPIPHVREIPDRALVLPRCENSIDTSSQTAVSFNFIRGVGHRLDVR